MIPLVRDCIEEYETRGTDEREPDQDEAPSLGWTQDFNQQRALSDCRADDKDLEYEHDGREPSLGAPEDYADVRLLDISVNIHQRSWDDREAGEGFTD
jgi:hypothetical protein